jgi:hypothetical protein
MKIKYSFLLILLMSSIGFTLGQSQIGNDIDGERAGDNSGTRTAISGDGNTVVIGAPKNYGSQVQGTSPGHVRVYKKVSGKWVQKGTDIDGSGNECFGATVAISRNAEIIAVGAPCVGSGVVRIYKFSSAKWTQIGKDIKGEALSDYFGCSVSLSDSGNRIAVGAYGNDGTSTFTGDQRGHVRVFEYKNGDWSQLGADIDGVAEGDFSGMGVSISGNGFILAIGSPRNATSGKGSGQVRIFEFFSGNWKQKGKVINGEAIADYFGQSLSLNAKGNIIAIGAPYSDAPGGVVYGDYGSVKVFVLKDSVWSQMGSAINGRKSNDNFGWSVALNGQGDVFIAGAPNNDSAGIDAGHARIYKWDSNAWTQVKNDINGESAGDQSGYSVSISSSGSTFAVGAPYNDGVGSNGGHVRIYVTCNIKYTTDSIVACKSHKWTNGVIYTSNNNTATDTFINVEGCDSIVSLRLRINQPTFKVISQNSCDNFISASLKKWVKSGIYNDTIPNFKGCDSIITYNLLITHTDSIITKQPTNQIVIPNGDAFFILKSNNANTRYQWQSDIGFGFINLSNAVQYSNVKGDTLKISNVTSSNNAQPFRCIVSQNNCYDTSQTAVLEVSTNAKTYDVSRKRVFSIYPSPNNGQLFLNVNSELIGNQYAVCNTSGKVVSQGIVNELITIVQLENLNDGVYLFTLRNNNEVFIIRR